MGQMDKKLDKVLELFYEYPEKKFTIREVAKATKIPKSTVQQYLGELKKTNLISKENEVLYSDFFRIKKIHFYVEKLFESGFINYLEKKLLPSCIILFGSFSRGESVKDSDIDIFIETTKNVALDFAPFEKKLKHKVQVFKEKKVTGLPDRLFNNVINGIKLKGYLKIKWIIYLVGINAKKNLSGEFLLIRKK